MWLITPCKERNINKYIRTLIFQFFLGLRTQALCRAKRKKPCPVREGEGKKKAAGVARQARRRKAEPAYSGL